jgi:fatty acid desaturase
MIPTRLNLSLATLTALAHAVLLAVLPCVLLPHDAAWAWLLVPLVLVTIPHWALIHEAVHGHLMPGRVANDRLGRILAILFGAPFDVLRVGHLSHHALNARAVERPELYDPSARSRLLAILGYFPRLLGGLYLVELASSALAWLPRRGLRPIVRRLFYEGEVEAGATPDRAERQLLSPHSLARIRVDGAAVLILLALALLLWGEAWPWLVGALLGRAFLVSFLDNAPHYLGELGDPRQGHDMLLPRPLAGLVLHANLHGTHHRHPDLPWTELPRRFALDRARPAGSWFVVPWRQLRGPVPVTALARDRA